MIDKLTARTVQAAKPGKERGFIWDTELKGFGLIVHPSGQKAYVVRYVSHAGRDRRLVLGRHGVLTPAAARALAKQHLATVATGGDPAAERREARSALTVRDIWTKYDAEHLSKKKPQTRREVQLIFDSKERGILRHLGTRKVTNVTTEDVRRLHRRMGSTPYAANRALSWLRALFAFAESRGHRPEGSNPCRGVNPYPEHKRDRAFSLSELASIGAALRKEEQEKPHRRGAVAAIRLLALTGLRRGNALALRWDEVDSERRLLKLGDTKSGAFLKALGPDAFALLEALPREGEYLFSSPKKAGAPLANIGRILKSILESAKVEGGSAHVFRHTVATHAADLGYSEFICAAILGHHLGSMTSRYAHLTVDGATRAAEERVQARIWAALSEKPKGKVLEIEPQAGASA